MSHNHFRHICRCGATIAQCRCPAVKPTTVVCEKCSQCSETSGETKDWAKAAELAMDAAQRFIDEYFGNSDKPAPKITIPARHETDSDLVLMNYITGSVQRIAELEAMLSSRNHTEETASRFTDLRYQKSGHSAVPGNLGKPPIGGSHVIPGHINEQNRNHE